MAQGVLRKPDEEKGDQLQGTRLSDEVSPDSKWVVLTIGWCFIIRFREGRKREDGRFVAVQLTMELRDSDQDQYSSLVALLANKKIYLDELPLLASSLS